MHGYYKRFTPPPIPKQKHPICTHVPWVNPWRSPSLGVKGQEQTFGAHMCVRHDTHVIIPMEGGRGGLKKGGRLF